MGGDVDQRWSIWVDAEGERIREEFADPADGSLEQLRVRSEDRQRVFIANEGDAARLFDEEVSTQPVATVLDDMVGYMRARIADGSAKVVGIMHEGDEEHWIVEWRSEEGDITVSVTMRASDYRVGTWTQVVDEKDRSGGSQRETVVFDTIEQIDAASLPEGFFTREAVSDAAIPGTPLDMR